MGKPAALARLRSWLGFFRVVRNWPAYLAGRQFRGPGAPFRLRLRSGLAFEIRGRTLDAAMFKEVFVHGIYTPPGFEIRAGSTVLDVGAHVGFFSALAARSAPGVRVLAFEPAPANAELLRRNLGLNGLDNVRALPAAVSGSTGEKDLHLSGSTGGHSLQTIDAGKETVTVRTVSLADVVSRHRIQRIDFLKLDCEGEEYDILRGCPPEILERVGRIAMECHDLGGDRTAEALAAFLAAQGFVVRREGKPDGTAMLWASRASSAEPGSL